MDEPDQNAVLCRDLVAGFADEGVSLACISPGSRNTPLTLAFGASDSVRDESIRDERSAGFAALGAAKATDTPSVVVCTSGSAAAHYLPAIVEADQTATAMIVATADRPVELRGTFAPQTMDQTHLYGSHVKASFEIGSPSTDWRESARAIVETARGGIPGVVHVNVPLAEPLVPDSVPRPLERIEASAPQHLDGHVAEFPDLAEQIAGKRVLIVAGGSCGAQFPELLGKYAAALSSPVVAGPQCRPDHPAALRSADMLARSGYLDRLAPDIVLRLGGLPVSQSLWRWLETSGVRQILVGRSRLADPLGSAELALDVPKEAFVARRPEFGGDASFLAEWQEADRLVSDAIDRAVSAHTPTEPAVARAVTRKAPPGSALFVGSSMPIRDVDTYGVPRSDVRVIGNRGVNGIDGSISTPLGMAMAGVPTTTLIGDVAALHDAAALSEVARLGAPLRVIVINNDGGGIFSFLPQRQSGVIDDETYEKHWGTPHGLSLVEVARSMGLEAKSIDTMTDLEDAVGSPIRPELIEITTDRDENVDVHRAISASVRRAVAAR